MYCRAIVRLFAAFVAMGFRRWSTYRLATAANAVTNTVFGLTRASITMAAIGSAGGMLAGAIVTGLALPSTPLPYVLGLLSLVLAVGVSFASCWLINVTAFWMLDMRGALTTYIVVSGVLSGHVVPVHWFPDWMAAAAAWTPFPSMIQTPIDVITGRAEGTAALGLLGIQAIWLAGLLAVGRLVFAMGARRLVIQGG